MNSLDFCGTSSGAGAGAGAGAGFPLRTVNSMLFDLHHQMAEQYHVYSAANPAVHTLSVAERLAGGLRKTRKHSDRCRLQLGYISPKLFSFFTLYQPQHYVSTAVIFFFAVLSVLSRAVENNSYTFNDIHVFHS